jgi:hypothetical protein
MYKGQGEGGSGEGKTRVRKKKTVLFLIKRKTCCVIAIINRHISDENKSVSFWEKNT